MLAAGHNSTPHVFIHRLQALMDLEDSYTDLLDLQGKDPLDEAEKLLVKKIDVLKYLVKGSASSSGS